MIAFAPITKEAYKLFHDGVLALAAAERNGIYCDVEYCQKMVGHLDRQIERLRDKVDDSELVRQWRKKYKGNFNIQSNPQLCDVLYNVMGLEPLNKDKPTVDEEALEFVNLPELQDMLRARKLEKAKGTYIEGFLREQVDGVIHTNFNLNMARSYRPSTDSPNLANVPTRNPEIKKLVRRAIKARPGHKLLCADFKGVEVSIAYCYHHDPEMAVYLLDKTTDMHRDMAMRLYVVSLDQMMKPLRQSGKGNFVFPQFYGDWWKSCAYSLWQDAHAPTHVLKDGTPLLKHLASKGYKTLSEYEKLVEKVENWMWNEKWPVYTKWKEDWVKEYTRKGYFDTLSGFRCQGVMDRKQAINYPIQGSAFHVMLQCIIWLHEDSVKEGWDSRICNQIYDDLMFDVHPDEEQMVIDRIREYMTKRILKHWKWITTPLDVEIEATQVDGPWYEKCEAYVLK